jgi:hypothetical protein
VSFPSTKITFEQLNAEVWKRAKHFLISKPTSYEPSMYILKVNNPKESSSIKVEPFQSFELPPSTKIHIEWDTHFHNVHYDEHKAKVCKCKYLTNV